MLGRIIYFLGLLVVLIQGKEWNKEFTIAEVASLNAPVLFELWSKDMGKSYKTVEEQLHRFQIFVNNLERIGKHNSNTTKTFKMKLNHFGDLTSEEFTEYMERGVNRKGKKIEKTPIKRKLGNTKTNAAASVDWTTKGVVTPIKDQGQCGSCWTFSTTGATECAYAIKWGSEYLVSLSEQELLDCSSYDGTYNNDGCNGGWPASALEYVSNKGGLCLEEAYPYLGYESNCNSASCGYRYADGLTYSAVAVDNEGALETALTKGCVSILIEADGSTFQFYSSGVYSDTCGTYTDHAVLAVGYGNDPSGGNYWKVKNSWGTWWGMEGYVLMCKDCGANGNEGQCGINTSPYLTGIN